MTNKTLTIDCNKEYTNKPLDIGGIRQIKLGYRPAGVEVWISTENTGDNLYKLENKGDGWINLPEVLENCYITTKGTNVDDKLVLYYSGDYSDFYATGNAVTGRINEVESLKTIGINAIHSLNNIKTIYDTSRIKFLQFINGSFDIDFDIGSGNSQIWLTRLVDLSKITFDNTKCYRVHIQGHCDLGGDTSQNDGDSGCIWKKQSLHLDIIDLNIVDFDTNFTKLDTNTHNMIDNIYQANNKNFVLERKSNYFCFWGGRYGYEQGNNSTIYINSTGFTALPNFDINFTGFGFLFNTMKDLIISFKNWIYTNGSIFTYSFHFSLKIQIDVMDNMPNAPIIDSNPYINNNI